MKYVDKKKKIPVHINDDRVVEFTRVSKGIGDNYLTDEMIAWHRADLTRNYLISNEGKKLPMPKYYSDRIFTESDKQKQKAIMQKLEDELDKKMWLKFKRIYIKGTKEEFEKWKYAQKEGRYKRFHNKKDMRMID